MKLILGKKSKLMNLIEKLNNKNIFEIIYL
jgi:hypothetical protein